MARRRQQTRPFKPDPGGPPSAGPDLTRRLHDLVREHPDFEVLRGPDRALYCFRYVPNGLADRQAEPGVREQLDRLNREIVAAVRRGGSATVAAITVGGRSAISASLGSHTASEEDVDAAFEAVARWGRLLSRAHPFCHTRPAETEA